MSKTSKKNDAPAADALKADKKTEKAIATWKGLHVQAKILEPKVDAARDAVTVAITATGVSVVVSKFGSIALQTKDTKKIDVESMLKDDGLTDEAIAAKILKYTRVTPSSPFISAPTAWSAEAKAGAR